MSAGTMDPRLAEWLASGDTGASSKAIMLWLSAGEQKVAAKELQVSLDAWSAKWMLPNITPPNMFAATQQSETVSNIVDPDMLPGGHDNPRDDL